MKTPSEASGSTTENGERRRQPDELQRIHAIHPNLAKEVVKRTQLIRDAHAAINDATVLEDYNLEPKYMLEIDNATLFMSDIFWGREDSNELFGRPHAMVYVGRSGEKHITARNFYKSNSQNSWRLLPGAWDGYFYKSPHGEQALNAPVELQKALDELLLNRLNHPPKSPGYHPPQHIGAFWGKDKRSSFDDVFKAETQERPWMKFEKKYKDTKLRAPEELVLSKEDSPDLSHELISWQDAKGNTKRVFASKDKRLKYEFLTDKKGRSCLALIECADAKINSFGLRSQFVQTGDYTTPLYEYAVQAEGVKMRYGDLDDERYPYQGMWRRYLSQAPFIREYTDYLRSQGDLAADYDDIPGQAEEDMICEIIRKSIIQEPLSKQEKEFITRPNAQFCYPRTAENAKKNLRNALYKRDKIKASFLDTGRTNAESLAKAIMYSEY